MTNEVKDDVLGFILLDQPQFDLSPLASQILTDWQTELVVKAPENPQDSAPTWQIDWEGKAFLISLMAFPVPEKEAETAAAASLIADGVKELAAEHQAFLVLTAFHANPAEKIKTRVQFTKLACSLLALPGATALYLGGNGNIIAAPRVRSQMRIMQAAEAHGDQYLPASIWINISLAQQEKGLLFFTTGLAELDKKELILHADTDPQSAYQLLEQILFAIIQQNVEIEDGPIQFSEEILLLAKTDQESQSGRLEQHLFLM